MKKLIILILALLALVACDKSSPSEEQITANRSLPKDPIVTTTVPTPEKEPFTASISVPKQLKSNEEFIVEATLKNLSDHDFSILHAAVYNDIKLVVNGTQVTPRDSDNNVGEPFISEGSTYLPVRAVAQALGQPVDYDGKTGTVYIGKKPDGGTTSLSDLTYVRTNGGSDFKINTWDIGKPFSIANKTLSSGIGYGYYSYNTDGAYVTYNLDSQYKHLTGIFGLDDQSKNSGDQGDILVVYGDGKEIYRTKATLAGDTAKIDIDITGVNKLKIVFLGPVRYAVFANPQLTN